MSRSATNLGPARPTKAFDQADPLPCNDLEPLLKLADLTRLLNCSRRTIENLKSAGKLPPPDLQLNRMPRWRPATVRAWIEGGGR